MVQDLKTVLNLVTFVNMARIVECVPNFSEGRDRKIIDAIASAIRNVSGVQLLDIDPGESTNRTVYTFVGSPESVVEGGLAGAKAAYKLIDMTKHKGEHPRMGALDVCPFIPVRGVTEEDCIDASKLFGRKLAEELNVPVFLYGSASSKDYRKTMPQIRYGEYEGLEEKLKNPEWMPDFGRAHFVPRWGGTVTGVRKFLIAYNINLISTKEQAHRIALNLREQGRGTDMPGRLNKVQGIGWYLAEQNIAQISFNLTDYHITPMHIAFEEAKKDALELNLPVTGSEIVGLLPLEAILMAADYYIEKEKLFVLEESQKVHLAINRLGLSTISKFNPKERIIEYCLNEDIGDLAGSSVASFIKKVSERSTAPGGGSVAALVAALGSALGAMAGKLTYGKRQWAHLDYRMRQLIPTLHRTAEELIPTIDADSEAFSKYIAANKLSSITDAEIALKDSQLQKAVRATILVPLDLLEKISIVWPSLKDIAALANINCKSDIQVGARCLETGAWGAYYNVLINVDNLSTEELKKTYKEIAENLLTVSETGCKDTLEILCSRK